MKQSKPRLAGSAASALGAIFLTIFLDLVGFSIIFPLLPSMLEHYLAKEGADSMVGGLVEFLQGICPAGVDEAHRSLLVSTLFGGLVGSVYSLLQFACSSFWGRLSDRIGRRSVLLITTTGLALSYALWSVSGTFVVLLASRVLAGAMAGNLGVATAAIADITTRDTRSRGMALIGIAFSMGFILGPAIGGLLMHWQPFDGSGEGLLHPTPFTLPALASLGLALVNLAWIARGLPETHAPRHDTAAAPSAAVDDTGIAALSRLGKGEMRRTIASYFTYLVAFGGMEFSLVFLARERMDYTPPQMTMIFIFIGITLILVQGGFVRRRAAKIGEKKLVLAGCISTLAGFTILAMAHSQGIFYAGLLLMAAGGAMTMPCYSALVSLQSTETEQGRNLGAFRAYGSLARAIGPIAASAIFFLAGSAPTYCIGGVMALAACIIATRIRDPRKQG